MYGQRGDNKLAQPGFDLRTTQHLVLTPRLQQSVKLLQLSALELAQELQHALANNPFLEEDEAASAAAQDPALPGLLSLAATAGAAAARDAADNTEVQTESSASAEGEADGAACGTDGDSAPDYLAGYPKGERRDSAGDERVEAGEWQAAQLSLRQYLHRALSHYRLSERDRLLAELVVEALEDDGYLRQDLAELASAFALEPPPEAAELSMAVKLVQQLDAPGIGARDLAECLHLQLQALDRQEGTAPATGRQRTLALAGQMIDGYLNQLARREYAELERALACSADEIRDAFQLIRSLDPKPGLRYGHTGIAYVVPDVIVRKIKGLWHVATNPAVLPRARLNQTYADLFKQAHCKDRAPLAQELQEARWLMRNVEQRFSTIQRVAETIVAHQRNFFEYGEAALKPFGLRECAELLGLHESTISRATANKYMATPRGIFEFKHFFSRELATESGGTCSAAAVRALLKGMVETEDSGTPLSDVELTRMLATRGVVVARRTVTKYRGQLKLPSAELRRQI
jgi:RNA polymerase sigma-54 factor